MSFQTMSSTSQRLAPRAAAPSQTPNVDAGRRQCWECQRRRIACDAVRPVCGKCRAAGVVCPGYEDKKPLTWLAPGKVKVRTWKRKTPAQTKEASKERSADGERTGDKTVAITDKLQFFARGLRTDTCDVVEATLYWNNQLYPSFAANQLAQSPWVVPVMYIEYMPAAVRHALVSMAIDHRIVKISRRKNDPNVAEMRERFHHHRCTAIRALNEDVLDVRKRGSDLTLSCVLVFLYADLMGSATAVNWRHHMNGFAALTLMRGGFEVMFRTSTHIRPMILFIKIVEVLANSTSPAHDQLLAIESYKYLDLNRELYDTGYYPLLPLPTELFLDIIRINRLRFLVATDSYNDDAESPQSAAEAILERIIEFSPEDWSEKKEDQQDKFLQMGQTYQSAAVLYAISSLRGVGALPLSPGWKAVRTIHYGRLFSLLEKSAADPVVKNCVTWPLLVAGFEAATGTAAARSFVARALAAQARDLGAYLPLSSKDILETFWASGKKGWDDCFDQPYALVT